MRKASIGRKDWSWITPHCHGNIFCPVDTAGCIANTRKYFLQARCSQLSDPRFLAGTYSILQGYRWSVNHKPKLDSDVVLMGMAAFLAIFSFCNAVVDL